MSLPTPGDRAAETSTTTGTGTYTLAGAITGWRTLVAACGDTAEVDYFVRDQAGGANYEVGRGTITDAGSDTLSRDTIYASSNADAAVNWSAGTREIVVTLTANTFQQVSQQRKNFIINGNLSVWQRGTSFAAIADTDFFADRFNYNKTGVMVHTVSRSTSVPTVAELGHKANYSILVDCTTIDASIAAGDFCYIEQPVEGYNFARIAENAFTISFWHNHTKTGTHCVSFRNSGSDRSYVSEYTQTTTNTWEYATVTVTASPSAGTWDYTTGVGLNVLFALAVGTTFHTTADAWQTGNFMSTSGQVNNCDSVSNNFRISSFQLEEGTVATTFEYQSINETIEDCQRYFEKSYDIDVDPATVTDVGRLLQRAYSTASINHIMPITFAVEKRDNPTMVYYSPGDGATGNMQIQAVNKAASTVGGTSGTRQTALQNTSAFTAAAENDTIEAHFTAESEL